MMDKANCKNVIISSITLKNKIGNEILVTWDTTDFGTIEENGKTILDLRGKGVYFDEEYANGKILDIMGHMVSEICGEGDLKQLQPRFCYFVDGDNELTVQISENVSFHYVTGTTKHSWA